MQRFRANRTHWGMLDAFLPYLWRRGAIGPGDLRPKCEPTWKPSRRSPSTRRLCAWAAGLGSGFLNQSGGGWALWANRLIPRRQGTQKQKKTYRTVIRARSRGDLWLDIPRWLPLPRVPDSWLGCCWIHTHHFQTPVRLTAHLWT